MPYTYESLEDYTTPSIPAEQYLRAREYFDAAQKRLGLVLGSATVKGAQCFFLAAGYYITIFRPLAAWRSLNVASGMCKHVLLKVRGANGVGQEDNTLKKLFWSCVKTEREVATELGFAVSDLQLISYQAQTTSMSDDEVPRGASGTLSTTPSDAFSRFSIPAPIPDASIASPAGNDHEQSWYYYLTDISLRKIEMQMEEFFRVTPQPQPTHASDPSARDDFYSHILTVLNDLDAQLVQHLERLPAPIALMEHDATGHSKSDLQEYLRLRSLIIRHSLTRPALYFLAHECLATSSGPVRGLALQMASTALEIDAYLVTHGLTTHRHPGTWLGICYCVKAALELFAVGKSPHMMGLQLPHGWSDGMQRLKVALMYWSAESRDAEMYLEWIVRLESHDP